MTPTPPSTNPSAATFCSTVSEASGEDPAGSAWAVRRYVMIELPLPWLDNSLRSRHTPVGLEELVFEVYERLKEPWGMIGIAPDHDYSIAGMTRIVDLQQGEGLARVFRRDTYVVPSERTVDYLRLLSYEPDHPDLLAVRQPDDQATREFFICTHGSVDICCATMGYPIYKLLRAMADQAETPTRVWRCTHFGGHRFAATALEAPEGRYWGHLKPDMLSRLVHRSVPMRELRRHYRGWAALSEPMWQIAEAALFAEAGWAWADAVIDGISGEIDPGAGGTITVEFTHPSTGQGKADIEIVADGVVQTMDASRSEEMRDAQQYTTRILAQRPSGCLERMG